MSSEEIGMTTLDVPAFFNVVARRSGDPTTEELHARSSSSAKRFNRGKPLGLHGLASGADGLLQGPKQAGARRSDTLIETDYHAVMKAGAIPATAGAQASSSHMCSGRVLDHGWGFLCVDGCVLAWEQGMVTAERAGAATGADQSFLRFDHPTMVNELMAMEAPEVPVEAADLVALSQPWRACEGRRELLIVSPGGLVRYWPDVRSPRRFTDVDLKKTVITPEQLVTRVAAIGPAEFVCGLSQGGVVRLRPGVASPCLLTEGTSVLSQGFGIVKKVGNFIGRTAFYVAAPAPATATDPSSPAAAAAAAAAAASSSQSPGAATAQDGNSSLSSSSITASNNKCPVVALATVPPPRSTSRRLGAGAATAAAAPAASATRLLRLTTETLEVWSVHVADGTAAGGGEMDNGAGAKGAAYGMQSLEARYPLLASVQAALGGGRGGKAYLVDLAVAGDARIVSPSGDAATSAPGFEVEVLVLAISVEAAEGWGVEGTEGGGSGGWDGAFSLHVVRVSSAAASWVGTSSNVKLLSSYCLEGGPDVAFSAKPFPRATLVIDREAFFAPGNGGGRGWSGGGGGDSGSTVRAHVYWPAVAMAGGRESGLAAAVTSVTAKLLGEAVTWEEGGALDVPSLALFRGCVGGGAALRGCPGLMLLSPQGQAIWVAPREDGGGPSQVRGEDGGRVMDLEAPWVTSEQAVQEWKKVILNGLGTYEGGGAMDNARLNVEALLRRDAAVGVVRGNLDAAVTKAGLEVLNGSWRQPAAFASPHQLVHLALREKTRHHRALIRFLLDAGAWGSAVAGRAALAEGGEKVAAAGRLCELQDAMSSTIAGVKASELLEACMSSALETRQGDAGAFGGSGGGRRGSISRGGRAARDRYFERTEDVLDAFVQLHTPGPEHGAAPSFGARSISPLQRCLMDNSLGMKDKLTLLNQLSLVVAGVFEAALRYRASQRNLYRSGPRGKVWTSSSEARVILFKQLTACKEAVDTFGPLLSDVGGGDGEVMCGVIGRLSVLLLDGFKEEQQTNPTAAGELEWQNAYTAAKALAVESASRCGRKDVARSLADEHNYLEGTVQLCHMAELLQPGCEHGHRLLRSRMKPPHKSIAAGSYGYHDDDNDEGDGDGDDDKSLEDDETRQEREAFARFVLDWHLRRQLKTALLDVGRVVPYILMQFLADWREAELLWIFQLRHNDFIGARHALSHGNPPPESKGSRYRTQHLWLSLAKLADLADSGNDVDPARSADIQGRLELTEVREELMKLRLENADDVDQPWSWEDALEEAVDYVNRYEASRTSLDEVAGCAHAAFQGYRALMAGLSEGSAEHANKLWREVVSVTMNDPLMKEAVGKGFMRAGAEDLSNTKLTDRQMEVVWKRPTVLHRLLTTINKDRKRRRERGVRSTGENQIDLTDEALRAMVVELMPAEADGQGATCEAWVVAIQKCPW